MGIRNTYFYKCSTDTFDALMTDCRTHDEPVYEPDGASRVTREEVWKARKSDEAEV